VNIELLNINFRKLSLDDPAASIEELRLIEWQQLLNKLSTDILKREQEVVLKEARSMQMECKVCMEEDCNMVTLPCMHISMCRTCCESHTSDSNVMHYCPMCRANIHSSSQVYFA
jgi:hypothetical protein